jgi:gas vesicle protein
MYDDWGRRGGGLLGAFLLGGLIGAVLGLLFAPRSGKETRQMISDKAEEYWGEGVELYESGRAKVGEMYESGKESVSEKSAELKEKIDEARGRLQETVAKTSESAKTKVSEAIPSAKETAAKVAEGAKGGIDTAHSKAQDALDYVSGKVAPEEKAAPEPTAPPA